MCIHFDFDNYKPDLMERVNPPMEEERGPVGGDEMEEMPLKGLRRRNTLKGLRFSITRMLPPRRVEFFFSVNGVHACTLGSGAEEFKVPPIISCVSPNP